MSKSLISRSILAVCLAALLPSLGACSADPAGNDEAALSGVMSLPLITSANGHQYRLSNAYVFINGPQNVQLFSSNDPSETALSSHLQTGSYAAYLFSWSLERDDGTGTFRSVQATLVSSYAVGFSIFNGTTSTVSYQFSTDGVIVTLGSGELKVAVAVDERSPVCTPFAADCASGTWCPPTGLTAAPRACIAEGVIAIGQPCSAPTDCVANASCFDVGSGPVCAELCSSDAFELDCTSGGTCKEAAFDYGVCTPSVTE